MQVLIIESLYNRAMADAKQDTTILAQTSNEEAKFAEGQLGFSAKMDANDLLAAKESSQAAGKESCLSTMALTLMIKKQILVL
jgi:hypothetical protein